MSGYKNSPKFATHLYGDSQPPLWERLATRALVSAVFGQDYRRHIRKAKLAARRAEAAERERKERESRRAEFNRAVEQSYRDRAKGARV